MLIVRKGPDLSALSYREVVNFLKEGATIFVTSSLHIFGNDILDVASIDILFGVHNHFRLLPYSLCLGVLVYIGCL